MSRYVQMSRYCCGQSWQLPTHGVEPLTCMLFASGLKLASGQGLGTGGSLTDWPHQPAVPSVIVIFVS